MNHKPASRRRQWADKIAGMSVGDSFFLEDKKPKDAAFLYQAAYSVDAKVQIVSIDVDEVYQAAGVRVKRMS